MNPTAAPATITLRPLVGTALRTEYDIHPSVPACTHCGNELHEGYAVRGLRNPIRAIRVRQQSAQNRRLARTVATLCGGCAVHQGFARIA